MTDLTPTVAPLPLAALSARRRKAPTDKRLLAALCRHIEGTGLYPALIVRPHPRRPGRYEIIDGRSRAEALRSLGRSQARCEIWPVGDEDADMLRVTLNRLRARPAAKAIARIVRRLVRRLGPESVAALLGLTPRGLAQQLAAAAPPPPPPRPEQVLPLHPVTFHLSETEHMRLESAIHQFTIPHSASKSPRPTRREALMAMVEQKVEGQKSDDSP